MSERLADRKCLPCEGGIQRLGAEQSRANLDLVPGWALDEGGKLHRRFEFPDFVHLMTFVNRMAALAESEGHHPDFCVHYSKLDVTVHTHAIGGLSENDFILAAKISMLPSD